MNAQHATLIGSMERDQFVLVLDTGNAEMLDTWQIAAALEEVAVRLRGGTTDGYIRDDNGNTVGRYHWEPDIDGNPLYAPNA